MLPSTPQRTALTCCTGAGQADSVHAAARQPTRQQVQSLCEKPNGGTLFVTAKPAQTHHGCSEAANAPATSSNKLIHKAALCREWESPQQWGLCCCILQAAKDWVNQDQGRPIEDRTEFFMEAPVRLSYCLASVLWHQQLAVPAMVCAGGGRHHSAAPDGQKKIVQR